MNKFKKYSRLRSLAFKMTGTLARRSGIPLMILLGVIAFFEVFMIIRLLGRPNWMENSRNVGYFVCYVVLLVSCLASFPVMLLGYMKKVNDSLIAWFVHGFALAIILWATGISRFDMLKGGTPIVYLTVTIIIGGIVVTNPMFYLLSVGGSSIFLVLGDINNTIGESYFSSSGAVINVVVFIVMALIMAMKNFYVGVTEERFREMLLHRSKIDSLTGLGNETAYLEKIEELNKKAADGTAEYAVMMLDVNNLKATNDKYGHRYGCSLVVKAGHELPVIFQSSSLFHIGGDEFIIIIEGTDYYNRQSLQQEVIDNFEYTHYKFDGVDLIFSVAFGYAEFTGTSYKDTLQLADKAMYENKARIKAKYGFTAR